MSDVWLPDPLDRGAPTFKWGNEYLTAVARLRPGPLAAAQAALALEGRQARLAHPEAYDRDSGYSLSALPLREVLTEAARPAVLAAFASLSLVLLAAAANTAALCFARVLARREELEVRAALGARPGQIVRQVTTENGVVLAAAFLLGAALMPAATRLAALVLAMGIPGGDLSWLPSPLPPPLLWLSFLAAAFLVCLTSVALPPALYAGRLAARAQPGVAVRAGRRPVGVRRAAFALVALETCLAFALLQTTILMVVSVRNRRSQPLGFAPARVLVARAQPLARTGADDAHLLAYQEELLSQIRKLPAISSAATVSTAPLAAGTFRLPVEVRSVARAPIAPQCEVRVVSADYFRTLGIAIASGRELAATDDERGEKVAVIDTRLASLLGPGGHPLAATLDLGQDRRIRVVGIAAAVRQALTSEADPLPFVYLPFRQFPLKNITVVLRLAPCVSPSTALAVLRLAVARVDRRQPLYDAATLDQLLARAAAPARSLMRLLLLLAAVAWALLTAGVQAVTAYGVRRSRLELGVRSACGARPADLLALGIGRSLPGLAAGILAGALLGFWLSTAVGAALFRAAPWQLASHGLAALSVLATALASLCAASLREVVRSPADLLSDFTR